MSDLDQALANRHLVLDNSLLQALSLSGINQTTNRDELQKKYGTWIPIPLGAKVIIEVRLMDLPPYRLYSR